MSSQVDETPAGTPAEPTPSPADTCVMAAVVTVSETRTLENDEGGQTAADLLVAAGHKVMLRQVISDDAQPMRDFLRSLRDRADIEAVMITGGTGVSPREQTIETLISVFDKRLPGYGEIFRWLSYHDIGPAAMLTRATAGLMGRTVVFSMPGSPSSVRRAMEKLILPQLKYIVTEARK